VSLARLHFTPGSNEVAYAPKAGHDGSEPAEAERIPDPRRHLVRYYRILDHLRRREKIPRSPPLPAQPLASPD
jgi:hypothetical protein